MKVIFLVSLLMVLSGCTHTVYVPRTEYLYPEDAWVREVPAAAPPDMEASKQASIEKQAEMNGNAYQQQTVQLGVCNASLETIRNWKLDTQSKQK